VTESFQTENAGANSMRKLILTTLIPLILMNSSAMADTKGSALEVAQAWAAAVNRQDLDGIVSNFAADASFFGTSTKTLISGSEGVRQYFARVIQAYAPVNVELVQVTVTELSDDSAVITGFDRWKVTVNGAPVEAIGRISMALAVRNGQWRIASFHRSTMPN
jgi:uncharacterized protein (TIGR02246 family)